MIILDTNVLSALMQATPDSRVIAWLDAQPPDSIWITSITVFESRFGIALLPPGKRRLALEESLEQLLAVDLEGRILDFDYAAACEAAALAARRQKSGTAVDMRDTQIAGIALSRRAAVATRNVDHFSDSGIQVLNPWI
ncbi:MAG: type II toxin-antitoxin system VapC family toxin [Steroidobacteraceae bacterium]